MAEKISQVRTNVITGYLGVGKTTAIRHLLENKPRGERWAVLVNEFGEVGVDGGLFGAGRDQVFIREVPGGCMCCTAGLPMQVALSQLLARARPQRLLIEPTGLGHPREVLATLADSVRAGVLELRATLTLVDARCLADERYLRNDTFRQQLEVADLLLASKADLYGPRDLDNLRNYLACAGETARKPLQVIEQGRLSPEWLEGASAFQVQETDSAHGHGAPPPDGGEELLPECGYLRRENSGGGHHSCGWRFDPALVFSFDALFSLLSGMAVERVKGVFVTERGVFGFNKSGAVLSVLELDDALDSRVEVIDPERGNWNKMEASWLDALSRDSGWRQPVAMDLQP